MPDFSHFTPTRIYNALKTRWFWWTGNLKKLSEYYYFNTFGKKINWKNPEDLNQWINWLEFFTDTTQWSLLADKYKVREYVSEMGYSEYLVPLLAVWDNPEKINFDNLPQQFVMKVNNGAGDVRVIRDKSKVDFNELREYFISHFNTDFGLYTGEKHYRRIKPYIIVEELLDPSKQEVKSSSLVDYKFWCFNGRPYRCFVVSDRTKQHYTIDLYTANMNWERVADGNLVYGPTHIRTEQPIPRPKNIRKMLEMASKFSKGYPQMRVDFYEVDGKLYFGELTMTAAAGRSTSYTDKALREMGYLCREAVEELGIKQN